MYYEKLRKNLFVDINYPREITELIGTAEPWRNFCALPPERKEKFALLSHTEHHDPGYRRRKKSEGREDKEYFHIYTDTPGMLRADSLDALIESDAVIRAFFTYATNVQKAAHEFALKIGRDMGKEIPEILGHIEGGHLHSVLRLLHYLNSPHDEIIAAQHFDRSFYTLHLYESHGGLQFMDWDMQWSDAPIERGKTVVFSGYQLERLTNDKVQKTWHRVVNKGGEPGRISAVLFVYSSAVKDYGTEKRAQDFTPSYIKA